MRRKTDRTLTDAQVVARLALVCVGLLAFAVLASWLING